MKSNSKSSQLDFSDQSVYVGMDVHKKNWNITVIVEDLVYKTFSQEPDVTQLKRYLTRNFPGATYYSAYEAGFSGFWINKALEKAGIKNIVVNPADIPTKDKEKNQKTDKRDSRKIARSLRNGDLEAIYVHSDENLEARELIRIRHKLAVDLTRHRNYLLMILHVRGCKVPVEFEDSNKKWTKAFFNWLKELNLQFECGNDAHQLAIKRIEDTKNLILDCNRSIRKLSRTPKYKDLVELLMSIPGIGLLTSLILLTELESINRFKSLDQLCSYVGIVPRTHASGEKEYKGSMTNRGNGYLKNALIESAWVAIRFDPALLMSYNQLKKRMDGNKAIIRIAKKLLSRIKYVMINQVKYEKGVVQ